MLMRLCRSPSTPAPTPAPAPSLDYTVSNLTELDAALTSAYSAGGNKTIGCLPGSYGDWRPATRTMPANVTVTTAVAGEYPAFNSLVATAWSNLTLDHLLFSKPAATYSEEVVRLNVSNNVTIQNTKFRGGTARTGRLLSLYGGDNAYLYQNDFQHYGEIGVVIYQQLGTSNPITNTTMLQCSIRDGAEDCIRIAGAQGHLVEEIYMGEQVTSPGPHAEMIQITLDGSNPVPSTGTIRNCLLVASPTTRPAGIQMTNADGVTKFHGAETYDGVWVIGTQYNALWFSWTTNSVVQNCRVYNFDQGDGLFAKLVITNSTNITQTNNLAYNYATATSTFARNDAVPNTGMNLGTDLVARQAAIDAFLAAFPEIPLLAA